MHLIHRSKKQALPAVNDLKLNPLNPYHPQIQYSPTTTFFSRKKSIDVILEKHHQNINDQILLHQQPVRKSVHNTQRARKAESGYLKGSSKFDPLDHKLETRLFFPRNKSYQLSTKHQTFNLRKKQELDYSPYLMASNKRTKSNPKIKSMMETSESPHPAKDWICQKFIENQVYAVEECNDFS